MPSNEEESASPELNRRCHHKYDDSIPSVREKLNIFLKENKDILDDIYNEDIEDAKKSDFTIRRFLVLNGGKVDAALTSLLDAFKWYKKMKFREITDNYFPSEVYRIGAVFPYEPDKAGRSTIYVRMKCSPRIPELVDVVKHYVSFLLWKLDQESREKGWTIVTDFNGSGFSRWDLEFARHFVLVMRYYFPMGLQYKLCIDIGLIWRGLYFMMKDVLPKKFRDILIFLPKDSLNEYVNPENIPPFLGGTSRRKFNGSIVVPEGCPSGIEFAEKVLGLNTKGKYQNFQPILEKIYAENSKEESELESAQRIEGCN